VRRQRSPVRSAPELGRVLHERRGELGLSREGVARLTGVKPVVLADLERGDGTIALQVALLIVQALGLDIGVEAIYSHAPRAREYDMFRLRAVEALDARRDRRTVWPAPRARAANPPRALPPRRTVGRQRSAQSASQSKGPSRAVSQMRRPVSFPPSLRSSFPSSNPSSL
jgi:transcriptional regulator with XRE-family HTH domain